MQMSDTAAIKTGLACSKSGITAVLQCKYGETAICRWRYSSEQMNSKRRMARKDSFLVALEVKCTLTDGSVEHYQL